MGDDDHGHAFAGQFFDDRQYVADQFRVEGRGGFVKQHHRRAHGQCPGDGHTLLLAARQLMRVFAGVIEHADLFQQGQAQQAQFFTRAMGVIDRGEHHVLQHGLVGKQVEALEDHAHVHNVLHVHFVAERAFRVLRAAQKWLALQGDLAMVEAFEAIHGADQRGFARAGRADDRHHFAPAHIQVHAFEHFQFAIRLAHALRLQGEFARGSLIAVTSGHHLAQFSRGDGFGFAAGHVQMVFQQV